MRIITALPINQIRFETNATAQSLRILTEPVTAYSNKFTGTVYFKISKPEILQAVEFWLIAFNYMTCT